LPFDCDARIEQMEDEEREEEKPSSSRGETGFD
jgi:hypothetical protein